MKKHYLFIFCDSGIDHFQVATTTDIKKTIKFYGEMPSIFYKPKRQNVLVYLEEYTTSEAVKTRFEEVMRLTKQAKILLVESCNPNWVELKIGQNIEL